ncbi:MAG TPA: Tex-like N-terminal domain-containing protein, partial [Mesorhizobium sp.]|nr:Tex-like N-terminal domain-containing protein [Mesorhizobium sp.]
MATDTKRLATIIAAEINARPEQAAAAIALLDEGATVPFVARYRKEATGGLDDTQLRLLDERLAYLRELDARRETILSSIREQGKLTPELEGKIAAVATKAELEDIYLPYKPKRRTKAQIARERGLGPLAEAILADRAAVPAELAAAYVGEEVPDAKAALEGARDILAEQFSENADLVGRLRAYMKDRALLRSRVVDGKQEAGAKFSDYFDHVERWAGVPSHRALAMLRGRNEEVLALDVELDADDTSPVKPAERMVADAYGIGR